VVERWKGEYRWEADALISLQIMTEHIMTMFLGMMYYTVLFICDIRNKLAVHAKRVTIQPTDIHLLRDLWKTIDKDSPIGCVDAATSDTRHAAFQAEDKRWGGQIHHPEGQT
jgi:histone H3/H4